MGLVGTVSDDGFRAWVLAHRARLRRTAFLLCGDWHLADDLVQDVLVRMYEAWPRVGAAPDLTRYSRRVLVNRYLDHRRRPSRREHVVDTVPDDAAPEGGGHDDREALLQALRDVPPGQRAVLVLRYFDDLSVEQTAAVLGTSAGTVKSQTSRGLTALRAALALRGLTGAFDLQEQP